jgi:hypothetical protein
MLQMHTNTINLTIQALQSRSLARLEKTVIPMAENIQTIHERVNGDLGDKIDDLHRIIMSIANSTPSLIARDRSIEDPHSNVRRISSGTVSTLEDLGISNSSRSVEVIPPRISSYRSAHQPEASPRDSFLATPVLRQSQQRKQSESWLSSSMDRDFEDGSPPKLRGAGVLDDSPNFIAAPYLVSNPRSPPRRESNVPRRESTTVPGFSAIREDDTIAGSSRYGNNRYKSQDGGFSPVSEAGTESSDRWSADQVLPPPAIPPSPRDSPSFATPSSLFQRSPSGSRPKSSKSSRIESQSSQNRLSGLSTLPAFEKLLFRNAAILCDVRGKQVQYAKHLPDEPDPRYNTEMVEAVGEARICVIRKRENREHGGTRVVTSIWALSDDGEVRCQQRLSEYSETVPYGSYFQPEKVSIAEGEMKLRLHGESWSDPVKEEFKTNWINYVFASEDDAVGFQSAVYGRLLIGSFQTLKTTVIHDGFMGTFAFEEQFANIEMLRLWEDDGVATPGGQGGVMALMHISSNFGEGWARWWMNSSKQPVRVKTDSSKWVRLKGLDITVVKPGTSPIAADELRRTSTIEDDIPRMDTKSSFETAKSPSKKSHAKTVKGVRVEFKDESQRNIFFETTRRIQQQSFSLPDL